MNPSTEDMLAFLRSKLAESQKALRAREQSAKVWRTGDEKTWKAAGCKLTKAQRIKEADAQARISIKCRREVDLFQAVIAAVDGSNAELSDGKAL